MTAPDSAPSGKGRTSSIDDARAADALQLGRRIAEQALRLDGAAWDRMVLRGLMEFTGAVGALMVWLEAERSGYRDGICYSLGEIPAGYRPRELPDAVSPLPFSTGSMSAASGAGRGLLLLPLYADDRIVGAAHLFMPPGSGMSPACASLGMLGALIGFARRHAVEADRNGGQHVLEPASVPASFTDPLTGLFTTGHFHTTLVGELERASRYGDSLSLLLMYVESGPQHLDPVARERLLATWGVMLPGLLRRMDHAFALEEETFAVILPRCAERGLRLRARALQDAFVRLATTDCGGTPSESLGLCMGGAEYLRGEPAAALLEQAAVSLVQAREVGSTGLVMLRHPMPEDES